MEKGRAAALHQFDVLEIQVIAAYYLQSGVVEWAQGLDCS